MCMIGPQENGGKLQPESGDECGSPSTDFASSLHAPENNKTGFKLAAIKMYSSNELVSSPGLPIKSSNL